MNAATKTETLVILMLWGTALVAAAGLKLSRGLSIGVTGMAALYILAMLVIGGILFLFSFFRREMRWFFLKLALHVLGCAVVVMLFFPVREFAERARRQASPPDTTGTVSPPDAPGDTVPPQTASPVERPEL